MNTHDSRLKYLVSQYLNDKCTPEEMEEFWQHFHELNSETPLQEELQILWQSAKSEGKVPPLGWENVLQRIFNDADQVMKEQTVVLMRRRRTIRWVAAASIVLLLGAGSYFFFSDRHPKSTEIAKTNLPNDIKAPETNRATITLANGQKVFLDSAANGTLAKEGNVQLVKSADGKVEYSEIASSDANGRDRNDEIKYNTISNPRGSKVQTLTLIDGTQVWLNAGSSITYPVAFVGNERKISMTGEAYFEVKHDAGKKFIVDANGTTTEVLGTHFNVNAYDDEDAIRVTLLEGSVKLSKSDRLNESVTINPGQQAVATNPSTSSGGKLKIESGVDMEQVMAWKDGLFSFKKTEVGAMMRQIARWYDVEVSYEGNVANETITGDISRYVNVSQVLKMLEYAGLHFSIDGKKVVVKL